MEKTKRYSLLSAVRGRRIYISCSPEAFAALTKIGEGHRRCKSWCDSKNHLEGSWICTRENGHSGPHIGNNTQGVAILWAQDYELYYKRMKRILEEKAAARERADKFFESLSARRK